MTITLEDASGRSITETRDLLLRPDGLEGDALRTELQRQLSTSYEAAIWGGRIEAAYLKARDYDALLAARGAFEQLLDIDYGVAPEAEIQDLLDAVQLPNMAVLEHARLRTALIEHVAAVQAETETFIGFPQMIALRSGFAVTGEGRPAVAMRVWDVVSNALETSGAGAGRVNFEFGLTDTLVEYLMVGGRDAANFYRVLVAALDQGVDLLLVRPGDAAARAALPLDGPAARRLDEDLAAGYAVLVPTAPVAVGGVTRQHWARIDPESGTLLGRGPLGGQGGTQSAILNNEAAARSKTSVHKMTFGICAIFHAVTPYIGTLTNVLAGEDPGPIPNPITGRSVQRHAAEYAMCLALSYGTMYAAQSYFAARAATAAAAGTGAAGVGSAAVGAARGRTPPPAAARPQGASRAAAQSGRHAGARPNAAQSSGRGASGARPANGRVPPPPGFDSQAGTVIHRPSRSVNRGNVTLADPQAQPPPPSSCRVAPHGRGTVRQLRPQGIRDARK